MRAENPAAPGRYTDEQVGEAGEDSAPIGFWLLWNQTYELARAAVISDVTQASETVKADLTVLILLQKSGGRLRQNALGEAAGWDRTRLSHALTRMETRGLISRNRLSNGVEIVLDSAGEAVFREAQIPLASAVERRLLDALTDGETAQLTRLLGKLAKWNRTGRGAPSAE